LLLKAVDEAANDSTEEWLRAVRYAARGGSDGLGCEPLLTALTTQPDRRTATVSQQARRLEAALMCVAELAAPPGLGCRGDVPGEPAGRAPRAG
jgi:GTPase involved in cell partitioning and DNA repair